MIYSFPRYLLATFPVGSLPDFLHLASWGHSQLPGVTVIIRWKKDGNQSQELWPSFLICGTTFYKYKEYWCYGLNVSPSKFICQILTPIGDGIRRWVLWEVLWLWEWDLPDDIRVLRTLGWSLVPLTSQKVATRNRKRTWPEHNHTGALILDFLVSRTMRNEFLLFISHLVYGILL